MKLTAGWEAQARAVSTMEDHPGDVWFVETIEALLAALDEERVNYRIAAGQRDGLKLTLAELEASIATTRALAEND